MHPSSMKNMKILRDKYLTHLTKESLILDVGGRGLQKDRSYHSLFKNLCKKYYIADIVDGIGVTHIMPGPYILPFENNFFDLIVSGQTLEHVRNPFNSF